MTAVNDKLVWLSDVIETVKNQCSDRDNKWGDDNLPRPPYLYIFIEASKTIDELSDIPAVDVVPVVHGHWIQTQAKYEIGIAYYSCSVCGSGECHAPEVNVPYCWKCGAKMDEMTE